MKETETVSARAMREEKERLSPYARCCLDSLGRERPDTDCPMRTPFQRDRDRIIHCKAFRRLMNKTQVFLSPEGDHYRTRLTHTLEVSQIARTIARGLRLNEDLTETIALGHDMGHTPFGHAGEHALRDVCREGFVHAEQSVRVARKIENDGRGLNLSREVLDGFLCHSSGRPAMTLEGRVVRYADKIAYMNHDIEDAIRAGVLGPNDIPWDIQYALGRNKSQRITTLVLSVTENSSDDIRMDPDTQKAYEQLKRFMFEAVYTNPVAKSEEGKAKEVVKALFGYFTSHADKLPEEYHAIFEEEGAERAACDYISGMSDRYAVHVFESLYIPRGWSV